jgi:hypothetical protein
MLSLIFSHALLMSPLSSKFECDRSGCVEALLIPAGKAIFSACFRNPKCGTGKLIELSRVEQKAWDRQICPRSRLLLEYVANTDLFAEVYRPAGLARLSNGKYGKSIVTYGGERRIVEEVFVGYIDILPWLLPWNEYDIHAYIPTKI